MPPGGKPGTIPSDVDQATGLDRLELIGKMQGVDVFDMRPLDASRMGAFSPWISDQGVILIIGIRNPRQPHHRSRRWR